MLIGRPRRGILLLLTLIKIKYELIQALSHSYTQLDFQKIKTENQQLCLQLCDTLIVNEQRLIVLLILRYVAIKRSRICLVSVFCLLVIVVCFFCLSG